MIGRERAVPLNRAVRYGTIAKSRAEIGMACPHFDLESTDAPERPMRVSRDGPPRAGYRRLRTLSGGATTRRLRGQG
jgi:hypothetical protein